MSSNEKELRELNAWIAEYIFDIPILSEEEMINEAVNVWLEQPQCRYFHKGFSAYPVPGKEPVVQQLFRSYTTNSIDTMDVLKKCLEKSGYGIILDVHDDAGYSIEHQSPFSSLATREETLELTICRFAKKLFSPM